MRISDWSSDVCSSDLPRRGARIRERQPQGEIAALARLARHLDRAAHRLRDLERLERTEPEARILRRHEGQIGRATSELQSLMRISYAVFCLQKKKKK